MKKLMLLSIILLSLFLRIYKLDSRPLGFTWDEAALGYNAYSLLKTGRDEYGKLLPVVFKSFGDYKPGAYIYFAVPSIAVLGLNEISTRLPSAIIGTLLVVGVYLLTKQLFAMNYALSAAILMAINPWAIHFSRGAWEVNLYLLLLVLGVVCFLRKRLLLAFVFFGLTLASYQGAKLFTPMIIILLLLNQRINIKKLILPVAIFIVLISPILLGLSTQSGRLKVFSVFSYTRSQAEFESNILFHNNFIDQTRGVGERYLNYFSPRFLFFQGDWTNLRHSLIYYGYFHLPEILTIVIGIVYLLRSRRYALNVIFWGWLLLAPLPAALSRDLVTGVRSLQMVVPLVILSGIGLASLSKNKFIFLLILGSIFVFNFYYLDLYYVHTPTFGQAEWLYPYKPAFDAVKQEMGNYQKIIFTDKLGQPYIFALFHTQYDPHLYQQESQLVENISGDVGHVERFGKFEFRPLYWPQDRDVSSTLFVGDFYELPEQDLNIENLDRISQVTLPDNLNGLRIVGLK